MTPRDLTPDVLLSTTRTVRKRLDLARPVERELIEECVVAAAFGDVQVADVFEGRGDGGADGGQVGGPVAS